MANASVAPTSLTASGTSNRVNAEPSAGTAAAANAGDTPFDSTTRQSPPSFSRHSAYPSAAISVLATCTAAGSTAPSRGVSSRIRDVSISAVYTTLDRLEAKGFVSSWIGAPTAQRGGRRRKFYALRPAGTAALQHAYHAITAMAAGLETQLEIE